MWYRYRIHYIANLTPYRLWPANFLYVYHILIVLIVNSLLESRHVALVSTREPEFDHAIKYDQYKVERGYF